MLAAPINAERITRAPNVHRNALELPRFGGHLIVSVCSLEGVCRGSSFEVPGGVPA